MKMSSVVAGHERPELQFSHHQLVRPSIYHGRDKRQLKHTQNQVYLPFSYREVLFFTIYYCF